MSLKYSMKSRRGRELTLTRHQIFDPQRTDSINRYSVHSAINDLDEFIANYTHDKVPLELIEARDAIRKATTIGELSLFLSSPYKIVRDAANDEMRLKSGLPPNSDMKYYSYRWGALTSIRMASRQMGPQQTFDSRVESFNIKDHDLARVPGLLAGSVHDDYAGHNLNHHLHARRLKDETLKQASIERAEHPLREFPKKRE